MSVDLHNGIGHRSVAYRHWSQLLTAARDCGWEPQGAVFRDDGSRGDYFSNREQIIEAPDARNIADALVRSVPEWPGEAQPWVRGMVRFLRGGEIVLY